MCNLFLSSLGCWLMAAAIPAMAADDAGPASLWALAVGAGAAMLARGVLRRRGSA